MKSLYSLCGVWSISSNSRFGGTRTTNETENECVQTRGFGLAHVWQRDVPHALSWSPWQQQQQHGASSPPPPSPPQPRWQLKGPHRSRSRLWTRSRHRSTSHAPQERCCQLYSDYFWFWFWLHRDDLVVGVSASHVVGLGFMPQPGHTKDYHNNVSNSLPAWHTGIL